MERVFSEPIPPKAESEVVLREQLSAPSHLASLEHNEVPPFKKPLYFGRPKLVLWWLMDEKTTKKMYQIARLSFDELRRALELVIVEQNIVDKSDISDKTFLSSFLLEAFQYGIKHKFLPRKMSALLSIYAYTHKYFKGYYWLSTDQLWYYFKELMFRHTINETPDGEEVFAPQEAYDIMTHFHTLYMCNLPLIHLRVFKAHIIKFSWAF